MDAAGETLCWKEGAGVTRWLVPAVVLVAATLAPASLPAPQPGPPGTIVFVASPQPGRKVPWEVYAIRPDGTGRMRLTDAAVSGASGAYGPDLASDRRRVVFSRALNETDNRVNVITIGSPGETSVDPEPGYHWYPKWSPDGRWIGYQQPTAFGSGGLPTTGEDLIWVVHPDGTDPHWLGPGTLNNVFTNSADDQAWDWGPDGRHLVMQEQAGDWSRLAVLDVGAEVEMTPASQLVRLGPGMHPDWSRRGNLIAFAVYPRSIVVARPDGGGRRRVTLVPKGEYAYAPSWSPDGRRLAFYTMSDTSGISLYVVRADGTGRVRARLSFDAFGQAHWSPDGRWLVISGGGWLYRVRVDGMRVVKLTRGGDPDWE